MYQLPEYPLFAFGESCEPLKEEELKDKDVIEFLKNSRPEIFKQLITKEKPKTT